MNEKISVIIPTYNRYSYLINTLESVKNQTYKNIEIIIVNDGSSQEEYYHTKFEGCIVVNMDMNSKTRFGQASTTGIAFVYSDEESLSVEPKYVFKRQGEINTGNTEEDGGEA